MATSSLADPTDLLQLSSRPGNEAGASPTPRPSTRESDFNKLLQGVPGETATQIKQRLAGYSDSAIKVLSKQGLTFQTMPRAEWNKWEKGELVGSPGEYRESDKSVRYASYAPLQSPDQSQFVKFLKGGFRSAVATTASLLPLGVGAGLMLAGHHGIDLSSTLALATAGSSAATFLVADQIAAGYARKEIKAAATITNLDVFEHELAHALDHAAGLQPEVARLKPVNEKYLTYYDGKPLDKAATEYFTLRSPELIGLYEACLENKEGHRIITSYAACHPSEYFAESVKAYVKDETRPGVNRQVLKDNDPEMYAFVENFFKTHVENLARGQG